MVKQRTILIVEDDSEHAKIFKEIMEMCGGSGIEVVRDGAVAMERLAVDAFDLILLDLSLPNVTGMQILQYVRSMPHLANTKVAATTGNPLLTAEIGQTADFILVKPFTLRQMREMFMQV